MMYLDNLPQAQNRSWHHTGWDPQWNNNRRSQPSMQAPEHSSAPDQVTLSRPARVLQEQSTNGSAAQPGSSDIASEQQMLGTLTDKSLVAMGIIKPGDEASTKITFDTLTYSVSSSTSMSVSQQSLQAASSTQNGSNVSLNASQKTAQFISDQEATFTGHGHIVTADGRQFGFDTELQISEVVTVNQSQQNASINDTSSATEPAAAATPQSAQHGPIDLSSQLLDLLQQSFISQPSANSGAAAQTTNSTAGTDNSLSIAANHTNSSLGTINWKNILADAKTLFDLLDSLAAPDATHAGAAAP